VPSRGDLRISNLAADAYRRGAVAHRQGRGARVVRVPERRERVRGDERIDRRICDRRAHLHRDCEPGTALHGRGPVQRIGAGPANRDDGRQPRDRRTDQHLERSLRLDVTARLGVGAALRKLQPGSSRPAHPGIPPGRAGVAARDGLRRRLHPDPRIRAHRPARPATGRQLPASIPAGTSTRPGSPDLDRRNGRAGSIHRGAVRHARPPHAGARCSTAHCRRVR